MPSVSLRPHLAAFNPDTPRRLSTPLLTPFNSTPTSSLVRTLDPKLEKGNAAHRALEERIVEMESKARPSHWFPYDRVRVVNVDP